MRRKTRSCRALWRAAALAVAILALPQSARPQTSAAQAEVRVQVRESLTLMADVHRGTGGPAGVTILLFHQGGGRARGEYHNITPRLLRDGYNVVAADIRGGGDRFGALQVGARRSADGRAVPAFSPASGAPMRGCEPAPYVGRLVRAGVPVMILRPRVELADSQRVAALEALRRDGATVVIAERGVHGSSMLDAELTGASTEEVWDAERRFLRRALGPSGAARPGLRYLANEGVVLEGSRGRVLIDALFGDGLPPYPTVPPGSRDSLERAVGHYGGPAVVLVTHAHRDHFDSMAVGRYRQHNPNAVVIGPPRHTATAPPVDLGWVRVQPLAIPHGPTSRPVGHAAYLVTLDGTSILHLGDTQSEPGTWTAAGVPDRGVDIALVPYWYALDEGRLSSVIAVLRAKTVVLFHAPPDGLRRLEGLKRRPGEQYPQVRVPRAPGEVVE